MLYFYIYGIFFIHSEKEFLVPVRTFGTPRQLSTQGLGGVHDSHALARRIGTRIGTGFYTRNQLKCLVTPG